MGFLEKLVLQGAQNVNKFRLQFHKKKWKVGIQKLFQDTSFFDLGHPVLVPLFETTAAQIIFRALRNHFQEKGSMFI